MCDATKIIKGIAPLLHKKGASNKERLIKWIILIPHSTGLPEGKVP